MRTKKDKIIVEDVEVEEDIEIEVDVVDPAIEKKKELLALYDKLIELKINRISDLESMIANCK